MEEMMKISKVTPGDVDALAKALEMDETQKAKLAELYQKVKEDKARQTTDEGGEPGTINP